MELTADYWARGGGVLTGGLEDGSFYEGLAVAEAALQWSADGDQPRLDLRLRVQNAHGNDASAYVGDSLGVSNLTAADGTRVQGLWAEFQADSVTLRGGLHTVDEFFFGTESSALFLHSAAAYPLNLSPNGVVWPVSSLGLSGRWQSAGGFYLQGGLFDADADALDETGVNRDGLRFQVDPEQALAIAETGYEGEWRPGHPLVLRGGFWGDSNDTDRHTGSYGAYLAWDLAVWAGEGPQLYLWGVVGLGAKSRLDWARSYTAGWRLQAPFHARPEDAWGLAVYRVEGGRESKGQAETAVEMTYRAVLTEYLALQASLQRVLAPGALEGTAGADTTLLLLQANLSY